MSVLEKGLVYNKLEAHVNMVKINKIQIIARIPEGDQSDIGLSSTPETIEPGTLLSGLKRIYLISAYPKSLLNFDYMLDKLATLGLQKADILHTAESMFHDHEPAQRRGLRCCHIYRASSPSLRPVNINRNVVPWP